MQVSGAGGLLITMRDSIGKRLLGRGCGLPITNRHKGSIGRRLLGQGRGLPITNRHRGSIRSQLTNGLNGQSGLISSWMWLRIYCWINVFVIVIAVELSFTRTIAEETAAVPTVFKPIINLLGCFPHSPHSIDLRARKGGSNSETIYVIPVEN
jgi:hypothetical protein